MTLRYNHARKHRVQFILALKGLALGKLFVSFVSMCSLLKASKPQSLKASKLRLLNTKVVGTTYTEYRTAYYTEF